MSKSIVTGKDIHKHFKLGIHEIHALRGLSLEVAAGAFLAISGSSGSGKTTLLNLIGCIDTPSEGKIFFDGSDTTKLDENSLSELRALHFGFIFQTFNLLPVLTAEENVEYPLLLKKEPREARLEKSRMALEKVGLGKFGHHRPSQLSGGQRQRVAIARALAKSPKLILADEPTANLDATNAVEILKLMAELNEKEGITFIFSSHDPLVLKQAKQVLNLKDGKIVI